MLNCIACAQLLPFAAGIVGVAYHVSNLYRVVNQLQARIMRKLKAPVLHCGVNTLIVALQRALDTLVRARAQIEQQLLLQNDKAEAEEVDKTKENLDEIEDNELRRLMLMFPYLTFTGVTHACHIIP